MKNTFYPLAILLPILLFIVSCGKKNKTSETPVYNNTTQIWADTIIYEVLIQNPDTFNKWENLKLKSVNNRKIVDDLFNLVYKGDKKAYDYYTNEPLSIDDIKDLEANDTFNRGYIGKLQFTESWSYDNSNQKIIKQVHSILLAYEIFNDEGELRGYKAAFYLKDF